jgi:hypothetical protein
MHQEEQHEASVDKNVHDPPEKILPQYSELKQYIQNKDLQQGKNLDAEKSGEDSFDGRKKPYGGRNLRSPYPDLVSEPGRYLINQGNQKNAEGDV